MFDSLKKGMPVLRFLFWAVVVIVLIILFLKNDVKKEIEKSELAGLAAMKAASSVRDGREIKRVSAPRDDWSDGVDVTRKSFNVYPSKGGCYRLKANGKLLTNGAGKHEICNGDDIAGGRYTDPRLVLKFQSVEETDLDMVVEIFPKPSAI